MNFIHKILSLLSFCLVLIQSVLPSAYPVIPSHQIIHVGNKGVKVATLKQHFKHVKPAIFVDFHGVVGIKNIKAGWKKFKKSNLKGAKAKMKFVGRLAKSANPVATAKLIKLGLKKHAVTESYLNVVKRHGSQTLHEQAIQFSTDIYEPNQAFISLLYKLKESGCRIYLFSNGGFATIQAVKKDPRFKHLFEGSDPLFTDNAINDNYQQEYTIAKPNPAAFQKAAQKYGESPENCIFIDDTREKLFDWRNKTIQKEHRGSHTFWACSLLYHHENHATFESTLKILNIL